MSATAIQPRRIGTIWLSMLLFAGVFSAGSDARPQGLDFEFHAPAAPGDPKAPAIMRDLAERILPVYQEKDPDRYLTNLSALQMVAGDYAAAYASRQSLRDRWRNLQVGRPVGRAVIYDIYAAARAMEAQKKLPFVQAFTQSFREVVARLNDEDAYAVTRWLGTAPPVFRESLQKAFDQQRVKDRIAVPEAMDLMWAYLGFDAYRTFGALIDTLDAEDDHRRYEADDQVVIPTSDGTSLYAVVVRPKSPAKPLPTLLEFTIYESQNYAKECAAHGYVGVVAYTRGRHDGSNGVVPYQHDANDARAVINWIAKQPWSDGRVAMYGDGYSAFASWAAAKRLPPALKAIAVSAATAPGIDAPMGGSIFHNSAYRWSSYVTNADSAADRSFYDDDLWRALDQKWYLSGKRYRDLGRLHDGRNPIFIRWLNHPSYDLFWQKMLPFRQDFTHINIPVLTMTGYYSGSEPGALYYFTQHYLYNPHAAHTLLIGPYDDTAMQRGPSAMLQDYQVDSTALIDLRELRYRWFDHVLKDGAMPALLKDRVNYQVMGTNEWRHAASLDAMAKGSLRFYLDGAMTGESLRLLQHKAARTTFIRQTVDFNDRNDVAGPARTDFSSKSLAIRNGLKFVSEPFAKLTEFDGLFSGRLDFTLNKMDVDLNVTLYELLPSGEYIQLFNPTYEFRASYVKDRIHRHLLKAGERQELAFKSERLTSRQMQPGSRLVAILGVNKRPDREINYGTGNDVSEESIEDGKVPLKLKWYSASYLEIPVRR
ncbi:MAG: CocE/NonD family hydrolase [Pseudomonadota bacterium]|nr:CocE/NonD family hydrolase [Pseudomonadota bacterium]